ncbi:small nuclear ribonucleoprotein complex protein [Grosmannia clavigera kw1407]|uniref:Small nuclear ribonucleoprotein complex protein n=1 Tax=Grosmannia clavigera (strain kw1407 / UAMH 11150) TaxID=655863 RepID=F0XM52_GROCL|nr:small nuclear ribonucleoprotein complex protein [Grosmannia clavigera kw1407]EFX01313.1 small nuclear ribonucleoprotein complex protein [Grosmannia clavigera kw1407]
MASSKERKEAEDVVDVTAKKEKKDKKEKKEKKEKKRSETDGVHKSKDKSDKKEKKQKKEKLAQAVEAHLSSSAASVEGEEKKQEKSVNEDDKMADGETSTKQPRAPKPIVRGAVVEFARPLAADKYQKKVFKIVKRAAKQQALLRGVKEVNKALRKAAPKNPSAKDGGNVPGVVIIAGDVNPAEVIMHLPLACEDVNAPYVFVVSRGELGQAARTKRPTSVVMIKAEGRVSKKADEKKAKKDDDDEDDDDEGSYADQYKEFVQLVQKEYVKQMKGLI